eukprot:CAMPEP_0119550998 /NCGR_PEP_ID=MMETSP1352-20130426/4405_1 /TAXON_ID=265584 /ORGANISM="Stauroneis constricta, Strain CCMP1120" /LENGTH=873 /DNA_ID=CAMNT_0007597001 /DNA_START=138 /DNA_END=2759 /DNA_ORIENTATION=-
MRKDDLEQWMEILSRALDHAAIFVIGNLPHVQRTSLEIIDAVFAPSTILRQLVIATMLQTGTLAVAQVATIVNRMASHFFSRRQRYIRELQTLQQQADSQDEWYDLAERIDNVQGDDVWRSDPSCQLYERERIQARIDEFVHLMRRHDIFDLMFELRGGIGRNKFGLLHEGLFSKAMAGSKVLVETYHNVVCAALDFVCDAPQMFPSQMNGDMGAPQDAPIPTETKLAFFNETRHAYGRTAVLLSGGAALGIYHVGVIKTLMENRLMPRVLGGSSAGSIVCALVGTRTDEECFRDLFQTKGTNAPGHSGRLDLDFFRPLRRKPDDSSVLGNSAGAFLDIKKTWQLLIPIELRNFSSLVYDMVTGNRRPQELLMSDTAHFRECVRVDVGDFTFQEAFDRTGRILNISVTPNNSSDPPRLLNYLTAPHVLVWSAVVASSSLPGVFEATRLMVRDADGTERYESAESSNKFSDGSMEQDLPMQQLSEMFNVNHFIISQANVHAVMFASFNPNRGVWANPIFGFLDSVLTFLKDRVRSWLASIVEMVGTRRIAPLHSTSRGLMAQFFTQDYEGRDCDIALIPWINHRSVLSALMHCLYNPGKEEFMEWIRAAERETWRHIPAIKSHIAEEVTLDRCVQRLRKRLLVESWEKRARQHSTGQKMGERVPSFFTSPSLVNLGGYGVGDQVAMTRSLADPYQSNHQLSQYNHQQQQQYPSTPKYNPGTKIPHFYINQGWGGQGLKGNRSNASLERSPSAASGLFIENDDIPTAVSLAGGQHPGEDTATPAQRQAAQEASSSQLGSLGYIKTTSMAKFYYRKIPSYGKLPRSRSHGHVDKDKTSQQQSADAGMAANSQSHKYERRKSRSHMDLSTASPEQYE